MKHNFVKHYDYTLKLTAATKSGIGKTISISSPSHTCTVTAYATADGYLQSGTATKTFFLPAAVSGDMNCDGKVDMQDANIIVNQYLGK